jgi:predicted glycogen debranching enzyme
MGNYFNETSWHEWVLTSKNGSYALGTGNLINQRKYNGLLIKSGNDFERYLLVSGIEEEIEMGGERFHLDSTQYKNCIFPEGFLHLVKSWLRPYPVFLYSALPHTDNILIKKEVMMAEDGSVVLIKYTNLSNHKLHFQLRPKYAMRIHHHLNEAGTWDRTRLFTDIVASKENTDITFSTQRTDNHIATFGWLHYGRVSHDYIVYRDVYYPWEAGRGYPSSEDLVAPVVIDFDLKTNESNYLLFSDKSFDESICVADAIEKRYKKFPTPADIPLKRKKEDESILLKLDYDDNIMFEYDDYLKILEQSMTDFIANNDIVAGFPWFGCWGRDTMISMEGVLRLPKGAELCYDILMKYAAQIKDGLIPNMCSESSQQANYISMDATLWFVLRLYQVCKKLDDRGKTAKKTKLDRWKKVINIAENVLEQLLEKPHAEFFLRADGLMELRDNFASATWMDAKVWGSAVTPRSGAPVEINALLFNAISAYEKMVEEYNALSTDRDNLLTNQSFLEARSCVSNAYQKFWIGDYLADRLVGDEPIREIRPNAIIATSLPFSENLLSLEKIQQIYETAHAELFTPYGLRTLTPRDPKFQKKYIGSVEERDSAYHQGTVWGWLLLPFAMTYVTAFSHKPADETIGRVVYLIQNLRNGYMRGHIASVAEVWDGDKPHFPKGCPAQAWSVAAIYTIEHIIKDLQGR